MKLVLASQSPRRRQLLRGLKVPFTVVPSRVSEKSSVTDPRKLVMALALKKAKAVSKKYPSDVVLGADTVVALEGMILGQPKTPERAYQMLYRLSGSTHDVWTGVAMIHARSGSQIVDVSHSRVRMKKLPLEKLLKLSHLHMDKAGAYAIQSRRDPIAQVIEGDYDNVVGLPMKVVRRVFKTMRERVTFSKR